MFLDRHPSVALFAIITAIAHTPATRCSAQDADKTSTPSGWVRCIGKDLDGWRQPVAWSQVGAAGIDTNDPRQLATTAGRGILVNSVPPDPQHEGSKRNLLSTAEWGDVEAHVEFMVPKGSNSGVYFMGRYEIQILDSFGRKQVSFGDCGGIYQRWSAGKGFAGHPPRINASQAPGEWQTFDVVFRAPRFDSEGKKTRNARFDRVVHNGSVVHENVELTGPTRAAAYSDEKPAGPLMLQGDHGPVAFRNLRVRPLPAMPADAATQPVKKERKHNWLPTNRHVTMEIEGFELLVDPRLIADEKLYAMTRQEIASQLYQITRKVPQRALAQLRKVRIFVEATSRTQCMAYHPSRRWLAGNGYNPDLAKCVELGNPKAFLAWTKAQPWMILHELAHAYHHQFVPGGFENPAIQECFTTAREAKSYEKVQHINGSTVRSYALTNHKEYFAEASEAFFGTNDMFPFVRSELASHDKALSALLPRLWLK